MGKERSTALIYLKSMILYKYFFNIILFVNAYNNLLYIRN